MWLLVISHPDKAADSWLVMGSVGRCRGEQGWGRFRVERISGPISGCCSTYLDPRGIPWGDQGGGALLHQIGEIGAAKEQFAGETVAGGWAPPPFLVFLEKEREGAGYCAARLFDRSGDGGRLEPCRCVCFSVIFKLGRVGTLLTRVIRSVFVPRLAFNAHVHCGESLRLFSPKPPAEFKDYLNNKHKWICNSSVNQLFTSKLCFQVQLTGPSAEARVQLRFGPFAVRFPLTLSYLSCLHSNCPFTIKAPQHILNKLFKSVCFVKLILNHIWDLRENCVNRPRSLPSTHSVKKQRWWVSVSVQSVQLQSKVKG